MSRPFRLSSELTGAIAKRLPYAKNQLSAPGSFFNQFVTSACPLSVTLNRLDLLFSIFVNYFILLLSGTFEKGNC